MKNTLTEEEIASEIAIFLNKHASNRKAVIVEDFEFEILGLEDVNITPDSIAGLYQYAYQFDGKANASLLEKASNVTTTNIPAQIQGMAFYAQDSDGDFNLLKIDITKVKVKFTK